MATAKNHILEGGKLRSFVSLKNRKQAERHTFCEQSFSMILPNNTGVVSSADTSSYGEAFAAAVILKYFSMVSFVLGKAITSLTKNK